MRKFVAEVENDKWRQVSVKLQKPGLSPKACQEKWDELMEDDEVAARMRRHPSEEEVAEEEDETSTDVEMS